LSTGQDARPTSIFDLTEAARNLLDDAQDGDVEAMACCCRGYMDGRMGFPRRDKEAVYWATVGGLTGDAYCEALLGVCILRGKARTRDPKLGVSLLHNAMAKRSQLGSQFACLQLGYIYSRGCRGVRANPEKALLVLKRNLEVFNIGNQKRALEMIRKIENEQRERDCPKIDIDILIKEDREITLGLDVQEAMLDEEERRLTENKARAASNKKHKVRAVYVEV